MDHHVDSDARSEPSNLCPGVILPDNEIQWSNPTEWQKQ
jgi:hypothetical protein